MKKVLAGIKNALARVFGSRSFRKLAPFIIVFIIGGVAGGIITNKFIDSDSKSNTARSGSTASARTPEELAKRQSEQLETNYKRAKDDVAKDQKEGDLTSEQADMLVKKIDEIYNYRTKDLKGLSTADARKKLSEKRSEWRKWATDNKLSTRYIIRLTI